MTEKERGCTARHVEIKRDELPLCCPLPNQRLWDAHPRVYLPIEKTGTVICPYCETHFTLVES